MTITERKEKLASKVAKLAKVEDGLLVSGVICFSIIALLVEYSLVIAASGVGVILLLSVVYAWVDARLKSYQKTLETIKKRSYRKPLIIRMEGMNYAS